MILPGKHLHAKEANMGSDFIKRLRSLVKTAICLLAIIFVITGVAPDVLSQRSQGTDTGQTQRRRTRARRKKGFLESLKTTIQVGATIRSLEGDRPGKFQETRDFPFGPVLQGIHMKFESAESPFFLEAEGLELGERDRRVSAEAGRVGKVRTRFLWDQLPHYFSDGRTLHVSTAPGFLAVAPAIRARLQAVPNAGASASQLGTALPTQVRQEIQAAAPVQLRVRFGQLLVDQSYHPNKNWELYFRVQYVSRNGTRARPTGTFARENVGPLGDGVWEALGMELPEPVSYGTTNLTFGVQYSRPKWRVGVDYNLSLFRNSIPSLTWENPFRVTDSLAVSPAFSVGRNRFVRGQLALPPDSDFQSIRVHGSVDLPYHTQLRGVLTWGKGTQNEQFLPYTLNSAMRPPNLLAGQPALFDLAPPRASLNGEVQTLNQDYALASKPWDNLRFLLQY